MTDIPAYREIGLRELNGLSEAKPIHARAARSSAVELHGAETDGGNVLLPLTRRLFRIAMGFASALAACRS